MGGTPLGILLALTLAAPPPTRPADPPAAPDRALSAEAEMFARTLIDLAERVARDYARPVKVPDLLATGLDAVYETAGRKVPAEFREKLTTADGSTDYLVTLAEARVALGRHDELTGWKAFVIAANGFSRITDPSGVLVWKRPQDSTSAANSDTEFGLGFEIDGVTRGNWVAYMLDSVRSAGLPEGAVTVRPPVGHRWTVRRVLPRSPSARAGLRPGDVITHLDETEITPDTNPDLFRRLAAVAIPELRDSGTVDASKPLKLRVQRPGAAAPLDLAVAREGYVPESIFGVMRRDDGTWDYMLDKEARIGYVRIGAVENPAANEFALAVDWLIREGAVGVVLDLRWCPGGWVTPTAAICGTLLKPGTLVANVEYNNPSQNSPRTYAAQGAPRGTFLNLPVLVLVNGATTGGGEMIAAALQDHGRAVVAGSRTFGKANVMHVKDTPFPGLGYRVSTGYSSRPNGKPRHRFPDSKPTDEWGVRPDKGYEIPTTPDLSAKLRAAAELQAIRPPGDRSPVPFDDPLSDPQKLVAVKFLKEIIKAGK